MDISFDPVKRAKCLAERGLDFADAGLLFMDEADAITIPSPGDHGEDRFLTVGAFRGRYVLVVWTPRDGGRRVMSMRGIHDDERRKLLARLG